VTQGMVRTAQFMQSSFLPMVAGTRVEFRGNHCCQDCALEDLGVFAQPRIASPRLNRMSMPVSKRSGPVGSGTMTSSPERGRRRPPDLRASFSGP
jgi:hypothetical protein